MARTTPNRIDTTIRKLLYPGVNDRGECPLIDTGDTESPIDVRNDIAAAVTVDGPVEPPESEDYKNLLR